MLETERAGAKSLVVYMGSFDRNSEPWKILRAIQADEARNCALLGKLLDNAGIPHSHATGPFFDKAVAIKGKKEQVQFLMKGLKWAVRRFEAELPGLEPEARAIFERMRDSHLRSVAACESAAQSLPS